MCIVCVFFLLYAKRVLVGVLYDSRVRDIIFEQTQLIYTSNEKNKTTVYISVTIGFQNEKKKKIK